MNTMSRDELEALTDATNHLGYIKQVIENDTLSKRVKKNLLERIERVHSRLVDDHLYMAVVGEASTGKSTFINALLGEKLLEARALTMTTATSTVIKHGVKLSAEISFRMSNDKAVTEIKTLELNAADEPITIPELPGIRQLSLIEAIIALTTNNDLAQRLVGLNITHTAPFLEDGICIVDTPGADSINVEHTQVTRDAVAKSDAAIIITPAKQIVSETLIKMILNDLQLIPFLHRCIFLITGIDLIKERERDRLIQGAYQRLKSGLSETQFLPPILYTSAQSVVDSFSDEEPIVSNQATRLYWQHQFETLKLDLFSHLKQQRALAIAESVLRLLNDLFIALNENLKDKWEQYKAEYSALEAAVIPDLEAFAKQQHQECYARISAVSNEATVWIESAVDQRRDLVLNKVETKISGSESLDALKAYIENELSDFLALHQQELQQELSHHLDSIFQAAQETSQVFDQQFTKAYKRLSILRKERLNHNNNAKISLAPQELVSTANSSEAFAGPTVGQRLTGAGIAMAIGVVVLPGVGLLLPAIVGALFGGIFGPSLDERKSQISDEIRPKLITQFLDVKTSVLQSVYNYDHKLKEAIDTHIDGHVHQYLETVQTMREEQQQQSIQLKQMQKKLEQDMHKLVHRRNMVLSQIDKLSSITVKRS